MHARVVICTILLFALAVRSLLPVGFMLQASDSSGSALEIAICTSAGIKLITVDANDVPDQPAPAPHSSEASLCPYAIGSAFTLASAERLSLASQIEYAAVTYAVAARVAAETPKAWATSARGPPAELV